MGCAAALPERVVYLRVMCAFSVVVKVVAMLPRSLLVMHEVARCFTLFLAFLALVGGVSAIQCRRWGWTIAGSIAAILICPPLGVPAIVLVIIAEGEIRGPAETGDTIL